jgi:hypothetical protein
MSTETVEQIVERLREAGCGGMFHLTLEIAVRMIENRMKLGTTCAKCRSTEVYCCTTTLTALGRSVECSCAHVCLNCGEQAFEQDLIWCGFKPDHNSLRCFFCSRQITVFVAAAPEPIAIET